MIERTEDDKEKLIKDTEIMANSSLLKNFGKYKSRKIGILPIPWTEDDNDELLEINVYSVIFIYCNTTFQLISVTVNVCYKSVPVYKNCQTVNYTKSQFDNMCLCIKC